MSTPDRDGWNRIYDVLACDERRELLLYLQDIRVAGPERVAQRLLERGGGSTEAESDEVSLRLHHVHLPKMAEAGLLTWDSQRNRVTLSALGSKLPVELVDPSLIPSPDAADGNVSVD